jgi:hypothetical protein
MFESLTRVYENKAAGPIRLRGEEFQVTEDLSISPVLNSKASVFGAEVSGVDWKKPVSEGVVKQVRKSIKIKQATRLTTLTTAHQFARQIRCPHLPRDRARQ